MDKKPLNSAMVKSPTFSQLNATLQIAGPRGNYALFENVVQPVWRIKNALVFYIDSDSVPTKFNEQFEEALQVAWRQVDSSTTILRVFS